MIPTPPHRIAYLTAGAGGMFCGSCLNDNNLARGLSRLGVDIQLIPTYTPIRTDEEDVSVDRVFFGGINVYLQQKIPLARYLPAALDHVFNRPGLIRWVTKKSVQADPDLLGPMTVSMLRGVAGFQRKEVRRLVNWLRDAARPELVNFSNVLIAGAAPEIRRRLRVPIVVTLQGDDVFLDFLPATYRRQAIDQIRRLTESVDRFIVHSQYYADYMRDLLNIPPEKLRTVPLGIDISDFQRDPGVTPLERDRKKTIGYLARLTPEKGLHILTDAFLRLREKRDDVVLRIAGWLGTEHQAFAEEQFAKLNAAGLAGEFEYRGELDRAAKVAFLRELDIFSVPTTYREPKGLFALEAMATGLPVVVPDHGAFPELVATCGGGVLVPPVDPAELAQKIDELLNDDLQRQALGQAGQAAVFQTRNTEVMAQRTLEVYRELCE